MTRICTFRALGAALLLTIGACAPPSGGRDPAASTVEITASEFKFESSATSFPAGQPIRFTVRNSGAVDHEWMIMPRGRTDHHQALLEVSQRELKPGATVTRQFTFPRGGQYEFACHLPGHYQGGMVLAVTAD